MFSNRLAFAALAVACIGAAAAGGYLAMRQNTVPAPAAAAAAPVQPGPAATSDRPVQETEAVVGDAASSAKATPTRDEPAAAPARSRTETERPAERQPTTTAARAAQASTPQPPPLDRTWPAGASQAPQPPTATAAPATTGEQVQAAKPEDAQEPARAPEPPQKTFEELVVPAESVIGLQTETPLSSERARIEDRVEARVTRDVRVSGQIAIPAGSKAIGSVTDVDRGGKFRERARLAVRFHTLVLPDGTRLPMNTETIVREGAEPGAAKKVGGGAVGGAILGAILGGAKGAAIGAAAGAGGGAAVQMAGDRSAVALPPGTPLTVRVIAPLTVTVEREQ
jgi:type IV secretory pathway VirB10-like protein